jgi:hypothetical protein
MRRRSRAARRSPVIRVLLAALAFISAGSAYAWIYPEHRDIAVLAVEGLDPERRAEFDQLWQEARIGDEGRLCVQGADAEQGVTPECVDWAALSGIAGDHSCSSQDMLDIVRETEWILQVADVAAQLKEDLSRIPVTATAEQSEGTAKALSDAHRRLADEATRARRVNALRAADTRLQRADPKYASRADSNLAHFVTPRPDTKLDPYAYGKLALTPGAELNAMGVYVWYHLNALQKASRLANEPNLTSEERRSLARSALFDEAFALHFLEDTFAAGHVAGSWGDVSQRKGTHDFYNQNGLEIFTWKGREGTIVLMGDAHMRPEDAEVVAEAVRASLEQVLDAAAARARNNETLPHAVGTGVEATNFDVCKNKTFPQRPPRPPTEKKEPYRASLEEVLLPTPVPGLGPGLGSQPRFRSEVGPFVGLAGSIAGRGVSGGFESSQDQNGFVYGLNVAVRAGLGLEGALGDAGDGLAFVQAGLTADGPSTNKFSDSGLGAALSGSLGAAIPARTGLSGRIRMPYFLLPGDLLFLAPLYFYDPEAYTQMATTAANGGLFGWQSGWATRFGRFQFILGRELGVVAYGLISSDQLIVPPARVAGPERVVNFKSIYLELPFVEYRPFRAFSANQSSELQFQLFGAADIPYDASVERPLNAAPASLQTVYSLGLRMIFDWRYYW